MSKAQPIEIAGIYFAKKGDALEHLKAMLNSYQLEEKVSKSDAIFLSDALKNHPDAIEKIGPGVRDFFVRRADYWTRCFWVLRIDGTEDKFSYKCCVTVSRK